LDIILTRLNLFMKKIFLLAITALSFFQPFAQKHVGIGTTNPLAALHVADSSVLFTGPATLPVTATPPPVSGAGNRMFWYADNAAFRAGHVANTNWDKTNVGQYSFATGYDTKASGFAAFATGQSTTASGNYATAMGYLPTASGLVATAMGENTLASGGSSLAAGNSTLASGYASTALGSHTNATGVNALAAGNTNIAFGINTIAAGDNSNAVGDNSFSIGHYARAIGEKSFALGDSVRAEGFASTAMGLQTTASGYASTAMGVQTTASGLFSVAMGDQTTAIGDESIATGAGTTATGEASTAMGYQTAASGFASIAMGQSTIASGNNSAAMGQNTRAYGSFSTAMGYNTTASGDASMAMGEATTASGEGSIATGFNSNASGFYSTAIGYSATASGNFSTAMGSVASTANHKNSFCISGVGTGATNTADNQMMMRFDNYTFWVSPANFAYLIPASNGWAYTSDINKKEKFEELNGETVLKKISNIPFYSWNFKDPTCSQYRHYGIMAQDFYNAFGKDRYGNIGNDTTVSPLDLLGVAYSAIKELEKRSTALTIKNKQLDDNNLALQKEIAGIKEQYTTTNVKLADKIAVLETRLNQLLAIKEQKDATKEIVINK